MRLVALAVLFSSTAIAEPVEEREVSISAGGEVIGEQQNASVKATADYQHAALHTRMLETWRARAGAELRAGSEAEAAGKVEGEFALGYHLGLAPNGKPVTEPVVGLWGDASLASRPGLDAPRDVARTVFAGYGGGGRLTIVPSRDTGPLRGLFRTMVGGGVVVQGDSRRAIHQFGFDIYFRCRRDAGCLHLFEVAWNGVSGGDKNAVIATLDFVKLTGLHSGAVRGDLAVGTLTNNATIGSDDNPQHDVVTEDLPIIHALTWNAGLSTMLGPVQLETRTARTGFISLDGDMSLEDRVSLTASVKRRKTTLSAKGFTARTQWWTSKMDPGSSAVTGGGELGATRTLAGFDLAAAFGVARSFYPTLDGAAVDRPATGARASFGVTRKLDL